MVHYIREIKNKLLKYRDELIFIVFLVSLDQISKYLVVKFVKVNTVFLELFGDFLRIIHVRNKGILFSIGSEESYIFRVFIFLLLPLIVLFIIFKVAILEKNIYLRYTLLGIFSGGIGNIIDRIFRIDGVVDFIDIKFFNIFGLDRWPTFNLADSIVTISIVFYIIFSFLERKRT